MQSSQSDVGTEANASDWTSPCANDAKIPSAGAAAYHPGPSYTPVTLNDIAVSSTPSDSFPNATTDQSPRADPAGTVQLLIGEVMGPVPRRATFALISTHPDGAASLER